MKLIVKDKITDKVDAGKVREYRKNPGNVNLAACAACHYAKKNKARMVLVRGNSYGSTVVHIARESDAVTKFTVVPGPHAVIVVNPDGSVFHADAE